MSPMNNAVKFHFKLNCDKYNEFKAICKKEFIQISHKLRGLLVDFLKNNKQDFDSMINKSSLPNDGDTVLYFEKELIIELDQFTTDYNQKNKYMKITRADIIKNVIYEFVKDYKEIQE